MSSLRQLFEEAMMYEKKKKGASGLKTNKQIIAFRSKKAGDGSFKGNPWHAGKTGRFTKFKREQDQTASFGVNTGSKYRRYGKTWKQVTKDCGSDKSTPETGIKGNPAGRTPKGSPQRSAINVWSKGPSPKRGNCTTDSFGPGLGKGTPEGKKQALNLQGTDKEKDEKEKKKQQRPGGRKKGAAVTASYDSDDLFLSRLFEGGEQQHPLAYVDGAREASREALEALYAMPNADDYDEVVEAAEHLDYAAQLLDYEEGYDED